MILATSVLTKPRSQSAMKTLDKSESPKELKPANTYTDICSNVKSPYVLKR